MTEQDTELIDIRSNEFHELMISADCSGRSLAEKTIRWLRPWWIQKGLPVREGTDFPIMSTDMLCHASAVTSIWMWEHAGLHRLASPHIHTSDFALQHFVDRVMSADVNQYMSDEGKQLFAAVSAFERELLVPISIGQVGIASSMAMVIDAPEPNGLDLLAELLLEFSDSIGNTVDALKKEAN